MKRQIVVVISIVFVLIAGSCTKSDSERDYRQDMRDFVQGISDYTKEIESNFIVIPQNGHELLTENGEASGTPAAAYVGSIDGVGREDLFYGYANDDEPTPASERDYMVEFMDLAEDNALEVLVTDYCSAETYVDDSYAQNNAKGYISFATDHRELDNIPSYPAEPYNVNDSDIGSLSQAQNFLYLINPESFASKNEFLDQLSQTDYDVLILDLFFEGVQLNPSDIASLKTKANSGSRLVIAYMSIGEAEDYRYYWQDEWQTSPPSWLAEENPDWPGNYKVRYWDQDWQGIIYGNDNSYAKRIIDAGFDGVYLDIIDAYEYFENQ